MIPNDLLDQWQALCDAATPGPWIAQRVGGMHMDGTPDAMIVEAQVEGIWERLLQTSIGPADRRQRAVNAEFAAVAREAIPALIAEVRRLRDEIERARRS